MRGAGDGDNSLGVNNSVPIRVGAAASVVTSERHATTRSAGDVGTVACVAVGGVGGIAVSMLLSLS